MDDKYKNRTILLNEKIDGSTAEKIIKEIFEINFYDDTKEENLLNYTREPIKLYINSNGGSAYACISIIEAMRMSKTKVDTYCIGRALSAGFLIFLAGNKRFSGKYSSFLYHQMIIPNHSTSGSLKYFRKLLEESIKLQNIFDKFITDNTNIKQEELDKWKNTDTDWFIYSDEALKLGICHEVI